MTRGCGAFCCPGRCNSDAPAHPGLQKCLRANQIEQRNGRVNAGLVFVCEHCFEQCPVYDTLACELAIQQQLANEREIGAQRAPRELFRAALRATGNHFGRQSIGKGRPRDRAFAAIQHSKVRWDAQARFYDALHEQR